MTARKAPPQIQPPEYQIADAYAIQALAHGEATPDMQQRALRWIIEGAAATYDQSFHPDSPHLTAFAEGRRFVGNQIVKMTKLDTRKLATVSKP